MKINISIKLRIVHYMQLPKSTCDHKYIVSDFLRKYYILHFNEKIELKVGDTILIEATETGRRFEYIKDFKVDKIKIIN